MMLASLSSGGRLASGQEALRVSMAGDIAAQSQRQAAETIGYYNLLLGPVAWRFSSGLSVAYNDNVRAQALNSEGDFIFRPNVTAAMNWPVTEKNSLNLSLGAGYSAYLKNSDLDQIFINPGSGLSFNFYVGDFVINLHDRLTITENAYQNQSANGNINQQTLDNTSGFNALWDLNKAVVTFGYDHVLFHSLNSSQQQQPDSTSEEFFLNGGLHLTDAVLVGLEAGAGLIQYDQPNSTNSITSPDARQWNLGAFCSAKISEYLDVRLDAGYTVFTPDTTTTNISPSTGMYAQFLVTHRVNQYINYSLSAGHSLDFAYNGQPYQRTFVRCQPQWNFLRNYPLGTSFGWEHGTEAYYQSASYDQFTAGINLGRQLTQKLSGSLSYQFVKETSGQPNLNYINNIVSLSFSYQF